LQLTAEYNVVEEAEAAAEAAYALTVSWANVTGVPGVHMTADACASLRAGRDDPGMVLLRVKCGCPFSPLRDNISMEGSILKPLLNADGKAAWWASVRFIWAVAWFSH